MVRREAMGTRQTRLADRLVIHGEPIDFRELCRRAVPANARYLVLDLDRTTHLARNMGELLGWEVGAYHAYGPEHLAAVEARRVPGRFFLDLRRPLAALRYLAIGARMWAYPGLFYLLFGKIPAAFELGRRWRFRTFGTEPVAAVQRVPQTALLHQLTSIPSAELRSLARRVWDRHGADLVVERDDLAWLRARCPGIRIVIASASPQPTVEVAAEALGVDDVLCSTVDQHDGYFAAPFQLHPSLPGRPAPRRLSGPRETWINSGHAKVDALWARYPDLADPDTVSVGMSDTGYGEDHCWLAHFTHVIDVNSTAPFPPIVTATSPLREIHSAAVLTRAERARRAAGEAGWLDPRRPAAPKQGGIFTARDLRDRLGAIADEVEQLARRLEERAVGLADARARVAARFEDVMHRIEGLVRACNDGASPDRRVALAQLKRELGADRRVRRELVRLDRPLAELTCALTGRLAASRCALSGIAAPGPEGAWLA
jgi:hypothetical protein